MSQFPSEPSMIGRRTFLSRAAAVLMGVSVTQRLVAAPAPRPPAQSTLPRDMVVYKDPNCGCCTEWVKHVRKAGFVVTVRDTADMDSVKASFGVPSALASCHTARIGPYTIEGHVPADLIQKLLRDKPVARGLTVPGMPMGSPGMEGDRKDPFDVLLIDKAGKTRVYAAR